MPQISQHTAFVLMLMPDEVWKEGGAVATVTHCAQELVSTSTFTINDLPE